MTPEEKKKLDDLRATAIARQGDIEAKEDEMYSGASPKGKFSGKALNALVDATNRLLPLFGIKDSYDRFGPGPQTTLPPEFVRILTMFAKAIDDAVDAGVLPEGTEVDLGLITDDSGLQSLAGRVGLASKSSQFKRFLMRKVENAVPENPEEDTSYESKGTEGTEAGNAEEMSESGTDKLFKNRM
jgi:hypothetical protein